MKFSLFLGLDSSRSVIDGDDDVSTEGSVH